MVYLMDHSSALKLYGVHPDLVRVVTRASANQSIKFRVLEGLRTAERQHELVRQGASWTLDSRHLTGHAVDLGALIDGTVTWQWAAYFELAKYLAIAADECGIPVEWGGFWGRLVAGADLEDCQLDYVVACKARRKKPRLDGPHFQLPRAIYP